MTEQKFNIPSEIEVYINPKKNGVLSRDNEGFVNITEIRRGKKLKDFKNYKRDQKEYLEKIEEEIGEPPVKSGEKRSTWVHEKILESVLRWYEVDEEKVIDQFVHPKNRTIGSYQYDKVEIMIHLETKHINASKFCNIFNTSVKRWNELESTQNLLKLYCKTEFDSEPEDPSALVVKHGLGYDSNDVWIPQDLLPMLATWCSPEYALFASKVMNLFHADPMKLVAMAVQEHDRQTGTKTTAFFKSTDDDDEHAKDLEEQLVFIKKQVEEHNATIIDQNNRIITLEQLTEKQTKHIQRLKDNVYQITYEKETLIKDNQSLSEQFAPVRALMNDHPGTNVGQLALTRKAMMDKNIYPLEKELNSKDATIKTLQEQLLLERKEKEELYDELSIIQGTMYEEARDKDEYIEHLESGYAPKKGKKKSYTKDAKTKEVKDAKAFRPEDKFELEDFNSSTGITSAAPPGSCSHLSVYTKRDYDGKNMLAFVPGRSTNYKGSKFVSRGIIKLDEKKTAEQYLGLFAESNRDAYIKYDGLTFTLDPSHTAESFERLFCKGFSEHVVSKHTATEYKIGNKDAVCAY